MNWSLRRLRILLKIINLYIKVGSAHIEEEEIEIVEEMKEELENEIANYETDL